MAKLARDYYDTLQYKDLAADNERAGAFETVLNTVQIKLSSLNKSELEKNFTKENIEEVLYLLPNGKAPGIDGVPYELWKWILQKSKSASADSKEGEQPFTFAECLMAVYNNIETHGVAPNSCFAEGLLNPLHKKKDCRDIVDY
ncbi:hypothetical protein P692DRAFT_20716946 [Suillus brevipes Sb2]|nr:hypothetical protein P692DRAFT_20716946 [Suillus brevipes Sb2]